MLLSCVFVPVPKCNFLMLLRLNDFTMESYFPPPTAVYSTGSHVTVNQTIVLMGLSLLNSRGVLSMEPALVTISVVCFQRRPMHHLCPLQHFLPVSLVSVMEQWTLTELSILGLLDKQVHEHKHRAVGLEDLVWMD